MQTFTFYHNPKCSKSRQALELLQQNLTDFEIVYYLDNPLNFEQISQLLVKLKLEPFYLIRKNEQIYTDLNLADASNSELIKAMENNPKLIERPIITNANSGIIARPPSKIFEFLKA